MQNRKLSGRTTAHARQCAIACAMVAEPLEARWLMSAAIAPVLHRLELEGTPSALLGGISTAAVGPGLANGLYSALSGLGKPGNGAGAAVSAKGMTPFGVNLNSIKRSLAGAPLEFSRGANEKAVVLPLPMPDGSISRFRVVEAPIMEPGLAAQFPDTKTFRGIGIDDPTASVRLDYSPLGFHAQVLSVHGSYYIDPYFRNDAGGTYASYYKRDITGDGDAWKCAVNADTGAAALSAKQEAALDGIMANALDPGLTPLALAYGSQLKTYRVAVAADGEYVAAVGGGTVTGGQNAVIAAVNRVTGVYETELGVRLVLVANNSSLIYTNASTDPYNNTNPSQLLGQNQSNIDSVIGSANYDIGHVFTTGGGGLAALAVVGKSGLKAEGETGLPNPTGDAFYIDYVAHEMGHQFGGNHTFNTANDTGNRNAGTAYEPGSGSTIMAYAGIEGSEDLQPHSDPYFHSASIDEIRAYITGGTIANVGTTTATGNNPPTVSAGGTYTIPTGTPFILTASGSDPDGDTVTYDWQERDLGAAVLLTTADNGTSPILRDWSPTTSPSRIVPRLSDLLNNTFAPGEKLPGVARASFKWRVIARDNKVGGGGVSSADVTLAVVNTGAAFAVTAPNSAQTWFATDSQTVTWNVAGTTANGINTATVNILLSTDGGNTWPITLASGTANDGLQAITVPSSIDTSTARVKVEAVGNIFFDISNANFTISSTPPPPGSISGQTYEDRNADGTFNGGDVAASGIVVYIDSNNNGVLDGAESSTTSSGSGSYTLSSVVAGTQHLRMQANASYVITAPASGAIDVAVSSGATTTQNFLAFPIAYSGTGSGDDYLLRLSSSSFVPPFYTDNFDRALLNGGTNGYTTTTSGDGGASIVSNMLTLTNDASGTANAAGHAFVATPTSAFPGFNPQLHSNSGLLTWTFNMQQARTNPSGFGTLNYGAAVILGATNGIFRGTGAGNGYAVTIGNTGNTDPLRLVRFATGLTATPTTITENSSQDALNHYWSVRVTYDPTTDNWSLFTRDDGTTAFADPSTGVTTQSGTTVADSTYTTTPLTHTGALWVFSTAANQAASFDNFNLSLPNGGGGPPKLEVLVNGVVTYSAPPNLPPSMAFNLGGGNDTFTLDSSNGAVTVPVSYDGQGGTDTWKFVGGTKTFSSDASALAEKIEALSGAVVNLNATQHLANLTVGTGSRVNVGANGNRTLFADTLSITGTGDLDLNDNDLVVNNGNFSTVRALVLQGFGNPSGPGISSSTSNGSQILALFDNALIGSGSWNGQPIGANAIVGKYTYFGDVNLDGQVTGDDYTIIDSNLNTTPPAGYAWLSGDANLDGIVTGDDYTTIDSNLNLGVGNPLGASSVSRRRPS